MIVNQGPKRARLFSIGAAFLLFAATGCESNDGASAVTPPAKGGSGGAGPGSGGAVGSSGGQATTPAGTGGSTQMTSKPGSGGSQATGGALSSGGRPGTGGNPGSDGAAGADGSRATDGAVTTGGTLGTGGKATGGIQGTGGTMGTGGKQSTGGAQSTGGVQGTGGVQATGGTRATGGAQSSGGAQGSGGSSGNPNTVGPNKTCGCLTSAGNYSGNPLTASIVVENGETYDGGCKTFITKSLASGGLGDGSQEENQKPLFRVNGGKLTNVILGAPAADGIHFYGNATAQNIHWLDIGEDASTIKDDATVTLDCGSAKNGSDKVFQMNAKATWTISNFTIKGAGKGLRENGGECYPVNVVFDHCDISSLDEVIFRTDCTSSKVTISNTRYSGLGDGLVMVKDTIYNSSSGNVTITNVQKY